MLKTNNRLKPSKFYQYRSLSHIEHLKRLRYNLNQKIYLSPVHSLNDPFEGHFNYRLGNPTIQMIEFLHSTKSYPGPELTLDEFKHKFDDPVFRNWLETYSEIIKNMFKDHGVFCLLKENNHPLMWAHYADKHQGYCLEFELDSQKVAEGADKIDRIMNDENNSELIHLDLNPKHLIFTRIHYQTEPPVFTLSDFLTVKDNLYQSTKYVIQQSIGVKGKAWKYEQEFRLIANWNSKQDHSNLSLLPIGDDSPVPWLKITGIIMGMCMSDEAKKQVTALASKYDITLMHASDHPEGYAVKILPDECDNNPDEQEIHAKEDTMV